MSTRAPSEEVLMISLNTISFSWSLLFNSRRYTQKL